jgi:hypothetical protein
MKPLIGLSLLLWASSAMAAPLAPVEDGTLNGLPLAEALAGLNVLGEYRLPPGGWVRLIRVGSNHKITCEGPDADSSVCNLETLFIIAFEAPTVPMDFTLFHSPEALQWYVAKSDQTPSRDSKGDFTLRLHGCSVRETKTMDGPDDSWYSEVYLLHVHEGPSKDQTKHAMANFGADLEKLSDSSGPCNPRA